MREMQTEMWGMIRESSIIMVTIRGRSRSIASKTMGDEVVGVFSALEIGHEGGLRITQVKRGHVECRGRLRLLKPSGQAKSMPS